MSENKICLDKSQTKRLMNDTAKMARGDDSEICPTVRKMYEKNVEKPDRKQPKKKTEEKNTENKRSPLSFLWD
jgi:hypothetical protein